MHKQRSLVELKPSTFMLFISPFWVMKRLGHVHTYTPIHLYTPHGHVKGQLSRTAYSLTLYLTKQCVAIQAVVAVCASS